MLADLISAKFQNMEALTKYPFQRCSTPVESARAINAFVNYSALQKRCRTYLYSVLCKGKYFPYPLRASRLMDNSSHVNVKWDPEEIIYAHDENKSCFACVVLNRTIKIPVEVVKKIWKNANIRCTVDGGSNRWKDFLIKNNLECQMKSPDFITGDFDSITEETSNYFKNKITQRVHTPDQDETDFTKSIGVLKPLLEQHRNIERRHIIAFHDTSGRLDHIIANLNTLYKVQTNSFNVYLLSGTSITWLLQPGIHSIKIPKHLIENERWCALMPLGNKATNVTTRGLKWNLANGQMEFGELVSTSNTYASEQVDIETDTCLVWSMGIFCFEEE